MPPPQPPRLARRLLTRALPIDVREHIAAELDEVYQRRSAQVGVSRARLWYWREALSFAGRFTVEENRRGRMKGFVEGWTGDFRHAARRLVRAPGFTAVVVVTLALAIGACAAIFSVVDAVLINPLAYPNADRLVSIRATAPGTELRGEAGLGAEFYVTYRDDADKIENIGMFGTGQTTFRAPDHVDRLFAVQMTTELFQTLGVQPVIGRLPTKADDTKRAQVALISHHLWRDWFASDPSVVGKSIEIGSARREIIGVMGPEFRFPNAQYSAWARAAIADESQIKPGGFNFNLVARMKPGVTLEELTTQLATVAKRLPERFGGNANYARIIEKHQPVVRTLEEQLVGRASKTIWIVFGTVGVVFLIACANVANLFTARAESRRREIAVRQALGAGRAGLIRSLTAEALLLAAAGAAGGAIVAAILVPLFVRGAPTTVPNLDLIALNGATLAFAVGLAILAACLFGLIPAIGFSRPARVDDLKQAGRGGTLQGRLARNGLVALQTAAALVLLVGAGLLVRSFWTLSHVDLGFDTKNIFTFQVAPSGPGFNSGPAFARFHEGLMERLRGLPGVESVGFVNELPLDEGASPARFATEQSKAAGRTLPPLMMTFTAGDYFQTMKIPLVGGRPFQPSDHMGGATNVIVSRSAAEQLWPGENPIGKRLQYGTDPDDPWTTVVGVVGDVRVDSYRQDKKDPLVYLPMVGPTPTSWGVGSPAYVVRTARADTIAGDIRILLREVAPGAPFYRIFTLEGLAKRSLAPTSFTMLLLAIAAGLAVILGAVGVYGVLSYVVSQRKREIALRMALGAAAPAVRRMVVLQGSRVTLIGVAIGIAAALGLTGLLESLLFGVEPLDAATFVAMSALMLGVAFLASYLPARRASSVDPVDALRGE
ncbi:MAG: ADOP family duplicated permease [Vicinamibacterales bacterium]